MNAKQKEIAVSIINLISNDPLARCRMIIDLAKNWIVINGYPVECLEQVLEAELAYEIATESPGRQQALDIIREIIAAKKAGHIMKRKIVFDHDPEPDWSWLEQDHLNPRHPTYDPVYRNEEDMKAKRNPIDGDWYRDPKNHVALEMLVYEFPDNAEDWVLTDSMGGIDFLINNSDDWKTGTFYHISQLPEGYLRDLAREAGLPE